MSTLQSIRLNRQINDKHRDEFKWQASDFINLTPQGRGHYMPIPTLTYLAFNWVQSGVTRSQHKSRTWNRPSMRSGRRGKRVSRQELQITNISGTPFSKRNTVHLQNSSFHLPLGADPFSFCPYRTPATNCNELNSLTFPNHKLSSLFPFNSTSPPWLCEEGKKYQQNWVNLAQWTKQAVSQTAAS